MLEEYPDIMTPREIMYALGLSKNIVYNLIQSGEIPAVRVGNKIWRIRKDKLLEYLNRS